MFGANTILHNVWISVCKLLWVVSPVHEYGQSWHEKGAHLLWGGKEEKFMWKNCRLLTDCCKFVEKSCFVFFVYSSDIYAFWPLKSKFISILCFLLVYIRSNNKKTNKQTQVSETDKLPKIVCAQCLIQVETIVKFRETCINAQSMLESCLNSSKLRNGGKVCIVFLIPIFFCYFVVVVCRFFFCFCIARSRVFLSFCFVALVKFICQQCTTMQQHINLS